MEFLFEYGLFLAQAVTVVLAVVVILAVAVGVSQRTRTSNKPILKVNRLNDEIDEHKDVLDSYALSKAAYKALRKQREAEEKAREKKEKAAAKAARKADKTHKAHKAQQDTAQSDQPDTPSEHTDVSSDQKKRLFVIDFHGDIKASAVNDLARCVTAILTIAEANRDEVLVRLESPGGLVHAYGLAAAQLQRIRDRGVSLTVAVDRVAASGGYMMAVVANTIVAAPFAVIGSIGVVAQIPNFHRVLQKHEVDLELHTAGEYKRTLTLFGHNTEEGRQKFITELEATHRLFKEHIDAFRPGLDLAKVATGEHWYGKQAHKLNLIDEIMTSDDYVLNAAKTAEILEIEFETRKTVAEKLSSVMGHVASRVLSEKWFGRGETGSAVSSLSREHEWVRAQLQDSNVPVGAIHGMCDEVRDALK